MITTCQGYLKIVFTQEREITIASYSETISSESSSEEKTLTAETEHTMSSMEDQIEDGSCIKENDMTENNNPCTKGNHATEIETVLHQIATSLCHAADGYLALASSIPKLEPYELPQVIAQVPPTSNRCSYIDKKKPYLLMVRKRL